MELLSTSFGPATKRFAEAAMCEQAASEPFRAGTNVAVDGIEQGLVRIVLRPGAHITSEDRAMAREKLFSITGPQPVGVLLQVTGVASISREPINVDAEAVTLTAFAIVGSSPVDRVIAHRLVRLSLPKCPSEYFADTPPAVDWLRTHARRAQPEKLIAKDARREPCDIDCP